MNTFRIVTGICAGLAIGSTALAAGQAMNADSPAVEKLKSKLPSTQGFEVKDVRTGTDGTSCITYVVADSVGTHHAVVEGDNVLRDTTGNTRFENSWNKKCVKGS